jgi:hypothetical protein
MPPVANAALAAAIVLSGLGAVTICLLIVTYGFSHPPDEPPDRATRRLLATRIGHAVAAACFAGTAVLLAVVLAQAVRGPAAASSGNSQVQQLGLRVDDQRQRIEHVERRVQDAERALQRVATDVENVASERTAGAADTPVVAPAPARPSPVVKKAATPAPFARSRPMPSVRRAATSSTAALERPVVVTPPDTTAPPMQTAGVEAMNPVPANPPAPSNAPLDLRAKLRADWRAIRRGIDTAGDDFRRAIAPLTGRD